MVEVSAGIVVCEGKILCMQKGQAKYPYLSGRYEFPGGKVEKGELPTETLVREFGEELEADISSAKIAGIGTVEHNYPDFDVIIHCFVVETDSFEFVLTEHQSFIWCTPCELPSLDWMEADRLILPLLEGYLGQ